MVSCSQRCTMQLKMAAQRREQDLTTRGDLCRRCFAGSTALTRIEAPGYSPGFPAAQ